MSPPILSVCLTDTPDEQRCVKQWCEGLAHVGNWFKSKLLKQGRTREDTEAQGFREAALSQQTIVNIPRLGHEYLNGL